MAIKDPESGDNLESILAEAEELLSEKMMRHVRRLAEENPRYIVSDVRMILAQVKMIQNLAEADEIIEIDRIVELDKDNDAKYGTLKTSLHAALRVETTKREDGAIDLANLAKTILVECEEQGIPAPQEYQIDPSTRQDHSSLSTTPDGSTLCNVVLKFPDDSKEGYREEIWAATVVVIPPRLADEHILKPDAEEGNNGVFVFATCNHKELPFTVRIPLVTKVTEELYRKA